MRVFYVVTIHNKDQFLIQTFGGLLSAAGPESVVIAVLDGCTDNSRALSEKFAQEAPFSVVLVEANDVHEVLALRLGMKKALEMSMSDDDVIVSLQDDVILKDTNLEMHINRFLTDVDLQPVGVVSLRAGAEPRVNYLRRRLSESDLIESVSGHGISTVRLPLGHFVRRTFAIRSPEFFQIRLLRCVGMLDADFAPYAYDAHDLSLRSHFAGFKNYVLALPFESPLEQGGTRQNPHPEYAAVHRRNAHRLFRKHWRRLLPLGTPRHAKTFSAEYFPSFAQPTAPAVTPREPETLIRSGATAWATHLGNAVANVMRRLLLSPKLGRVRGRTRAVFSVQRKYKQSVSLRRNKIWSSYQSAETHFYRGIPKALREHRYFVEKHNLGYGERAFHAMWWEIMRLARPENCLEIGVHKGQVISLWSLCAKLLSYEATVVGIGPFNNQGDSVSVYGSRHEDCVPDVEALHRRFNLNIGRLVRAKSQEPEALASIQSLQWDLVYIDGSHEYQDVKSDFNAVAMSMRIGGLLVLDDAALAYDREMPMYAFPGHPGPTQVAEVASLDCRFSEVGHVGHNVVFVKVC